MSKDPTMEVDEDEEARQVPQKDEDDDAEDSSSDDDDGEDNVYIPGDKLEEGETLTVDENAYNIYHQCSLGPPCLSFDIIHDQVKQDYPLSVTCVAGTQAAKVTANNIIVFRMSNLNCVRPRDEDEDSDIDEPEEEKPFLKMAGIKHAGCVNRVKYTKIGPTPVAAAWGENGTVGVWNLTNVLSRLDLPGKEVYKEETTPLQAFSGHGTEGFALDWSGTESGVLASGDCNKNIHVWSPAEGGVWNINSAPYSSHTRSVEDIRWSPNEKSVMASCSCDRTIKIWDVRAEPSQACMLTQGNAHFSDVNVIDWNPSDPFIISGGDDGIIKVWDLRSFGGISDPVATFKHHTSPVTSLEWHKDDNTVFASSGADDQIALWDLALERDTEAGAEDEKLKGLPPQLLFIHQGLQDIKEVHWHSKISGLIVATSHTGFDVFKTISV
ncbi:glutamate-rich WD repeat-containing protein 1 [Eurytemora carolleeae]|uniref:glutamate-rich WD repeat-containing protein 1 n=1 Tax=Eurytemora carolleeae TaxID=1294199 RepID=UPI000C7739A3|nr:glutamate-rich WD repeat-containing protein 1 [Eurytemora carolleeae]|eukprot:XP_023327620.1 glutamate-rich WD repeat-containing protein 1-like [Eurytemora affinis]